MTPPVRVLVAGESPVMLRLLGRLLGSFPGVQLVGTAPDPATALELTRLLFPDVVLLDPDLTSADLPSVIRGLLREPGAGVLVVASPTLRGRRAALHALELGAVDLVEIGAGPLDLRSLRAALEAKIQAVAGAGRRRAAPTPSPTPLVREAPVRRERYEVVVIGASTGGPRALVDVLASLPAHLPTGVVVAQHMPGGFTQTLAERLDHHSPLRVTEAADGDRVAAGRILVARGGAHIWLERADGALVVRVGEAPERLHHRPSIDLLFRSAAAVCGAGAVGVILTGMGDDGAVGLRAMREAGARTLAESRETAVIFGMPKAAARSAEQVLPLPRIGPAIAELCGGRNPAPGGA